MRFIFRLLCFLFGHAPKPIHFTDTNQHAHLNVIPIGSGPGLKVLCLNACARCDEVVRDLKSEPALWLEIQTQRKAESMEAEIKAKVKADADRQRRPGESIRAWKTRLGSMNTPPTTPRPLPPPEQP